MSLHLINFDLLQKNHIMSGMILASLLRILCLLFYNKDENSFNLCHE